MSLKQRVVLLMAFALAFGTAVGAFANLLAWVAQP